MVHATFQEIRQHNLLYVGDDRMVAITPMAAECKANRVATPIHGLPGSFIVSTAEESAGYARGTGTAKQFFEDAMDHIEALDMEDARINE